MRSTPYRLVGYRFVGLCLADAATVVLLRPDGAALVRHVAAPHAWLASQGADSAAIEVGSAALWGVALWVALGLLACIGGAIPGQAGRLGRGLAAAVLPHVVLRLLAGAAGLGVILAPGQPATGTAPVAVVAQVADSASIPSPTPAPTWPTDDSVPAPTWPTTPARHGAAPAARPSILARTVTVRRGDCLWRIAASDLSPHASDSQLVAAWPRWYAANRAVIGTDPAYLVPGEVLRAPASTHKGL